MEVKWIYGLDGREACRFVRETVFVKEQGFSEELEFDDADATSWHLSLEEDGQPVAAARLFRETEEDWHAGRICVLPERRGGMGARLLAELERKALEFGAKRVTLGAQCRARGFYEKCGYRAFGPEYMDEFCPHVMMEKPLAPGEIR